MGNGEMQQLPAQIRSVSDIYGGTDEIDFLLEEIRDQMEPACCQEDLQDYCIAGSKAGEIDLSIAQTPLELESPLGTCSSWDSHLNYRERLGQGHMGWGGVVLQCDVSHLKTPTGIVRILLVVSYSFWHFSVLNFHFGSEGVGHSNLSFLTFLKIYFLKIIFVESILKKKL